MRITWKRLYSATIAAALLGLLLATGCENWGRFMRKDTQAPSPNVRMTSGTPTQQELIAYLNENARRLQALESKEVTLDAYQGNQPIGLMGNLVCQKPRNFRLAARLAGAPMADLGSNQDEFWFWIGKSEPPYLYHCSHQDFAQGRSRLNFPFQPEWIMEALGMAEYDPSKRYQVGGTRTTAELIEQTTTSQGQPVRKIVQFQRTPLQVTQYILQDAKGKEICSAKITAVGRDPTSQAVYPRSIQLNWPADRPAESVRLHMRLAEVTINPNLAPARVALLFSRPKLENVPPFDLARGPENQTARQPLQPAGGFGNANYR
jgi:hypothetical protein